MLLLFCDVDADGNITSSLQGNNVVPTRQYDYFFFLEGELDVDDYSVIDDRLVRKEA